jgi:hypothetical protein
MALGTTFLAPANAWTNGNFAGANGTINGAAAASDWFRLTGVIVLPGIELPSASRAVFVMRPYAQELLMCQRYYWRDNAPSQWLYSESVSVGAGSNNAIFSVPFRPQMRAAPTITLPTFTLIGCNTPAVGNNGPNGCEIRGASTGAAGSRIVFYGPSGPFIADARYP